MPPYGFCDWLDAIDHRYDSGEADAAREVEEEGGNLRDYPAPAFEADSEDEIPF